MGFLTVVSQGWNTDHWSKYFSIPPVFLLFRPWGVDLEGSQLRIPRSRVQGPDRKNYYSRPIWVSLNSSRPDFFFEVSFHKRKIGLGPKCAKNLGMIGPGSQNFTG